VVLAVHDLDILVTLSVLCLLLFLSILAVPLDQKDQLDQQHQLRLVLLEDQVALIIMNTFIRQKNDRKVKTIKIQYSQLCETISTKLLIHSTDSRISWTEHVVQAIIRRITITVI